MRSLCQVLITSLALLMPSSSSAGAIAGRVAPPENVSPADFVIYVKDVKGPFPAPAQIATIDQKSLRFVPHVLAIQAGTTVEFPNSDPLLHNVFSISQTKRFNLGLYGRGQSRRLKFDEPGIVQLLCNVHLEMSGFIVVLENPYFAKTGSDGTFRIANVPAGDYRLVIWHERLAGQEQTVHVPASGAVTVDWKVR